MRVKNIFIIFLSAFVALLLSATKAIASNPSFSLYPPSGMVIDSSKGFSVDVRINTDGEKANSARFTLLFDPQALQLTKVEKKSSLFKQWPEDEASVDNENGLVMLTGFTQSGEEGDSYVTNGEFDIIARLTFKVLKEGSTTIDWEYDTNNGVFDTYIMRDGSPPTNMLMSKPSIGTYSIGGGSGSDGSNGLDPSTVNTAIEFDWRYVVITGVAMLLFGGFMIFTRPGMHRRRKGTLVVIGGDEKK